VCTNCKDDWQELRKELCTPERLATSDERVRKMHKKALAYEKALKGRNKRMVSTGGKKSLMHFWRYKQITTP